MPQSMKDRFTVDFEPIFFFTKQNVGYYFKQQFEPYKTKPRIRDFQRMKLAKVGLINPKPHNFYTKGGSNMRTTWSFSSDNIMTEHIAMYPRKLVARILKSGCPEGGVVLDPFIGSGTTAVVAKQLNMNYIGFELNPKYVKICNKRLIEEIGLF
jgi:site-specific DNA-methyltransferase (adenine-specific)